MPALAVADALRDSGAEVSFLGTREGPEGRLVPATGYEIDYVRARGIERRSPLRALAAGALAARATVEARAAIRRRRAGAVLGAAVTSRAPPVWRRSPCACRWCSTEVDRRLGLANRVLARWARRVCLAFPIAGREGTRYLVTGRPVPGDHRESRSWCREAAVRDRRR